MENSVVIIFIVFDQIFIVPVFIVTCVAARTVIKHAGISVKSNMIATIASGTFVFLAEETIWNIALVTSDEKSIPKVFWLILKNTHDSSLLLIHMGLAWLSLQLASNFFKSIRIVKCISIFLWTISVGATVAISHGTTNANTNTEPVDKTAYISKAIFPTKDISTTTKWAISSVIYLPFVLIIILSSIIIRKKQKQTIFALNGEEQDTNDVHNIRAGHALLPVLLSEVIFMIISFIFKNMENSINVHKYEFIIFLNCFFIHALIVTLPTGLCIVGKEFQIKLSNCCERTKATYTIKTPRDDTVNVDEIEPAITSNPVQRPHQLNSNKISVIIHNELNQEIDCSVEPEFKRLSMAGPASGQKGAKSRASSLTGKPGPSKIVTLSVSVDDESLCTRKLSLVSSLSMGMSQVAFHGSTTCLSNFEEDFSAPASPTKAPPNQTINEVFLGGELQLRDLNINHERSSCPAWNYNLSPPPLRRDCTSMPDRKNTAGNNPAMEDWHKVQKWRNQNIKMAWISKPSNE
ncbi:uncharacterized protein LOC106151458 [Lingula anatina]|uniref:Uncharacterized protein LOC106151458 n=1 Tax=Lingula anatina TaxID=7574 RepID=A0A1S3H2L4_LINAN|nr:uncharacterized protein LOC106151458 [Lingula anatina]|eukprot:XP_013380182.1 uncharacterized protein LOC106151458 [Lingula anatina]